MLMYWKIMFDRCYCINSTIYVLKFGKLYDTILFHCLAVSERVHIFSSPEHEVLMVSYCDQSMSVVSRPSCVVNNLF